MGRTRRNHPSVSCLNCGEPLFKGDTHCPNFMCQQPVTSWQTEKLHRLNVTPYSRKAAA